MKIKIYLSLTLIVLLAFLLRAYDVTKDPPSLNWDEVSIGYNAYSILKTGRDEWGEAFPIHFKSYGEYKLPVQIYASIPAIAFFGLNELGVRATPVLYGTLTVWLLFFLARSLFKSDAIGLISSLFLAISPWHIQLTRASFESSFATFWIVLGLIFLVKGFKNPKFLIFSIIPLSVAVYTYNTARVFVPLFLLTVLLIYIKDFLKVKKYIFLSGLLFIVLMLPLIPFILSGESNSRYKLVSITDDPGLIPRINENRGNSLLPAPFNRLVHNKLTYLSYYFSKNYLAHFTPDFLFIKGAPHKQHHVQDIGELYYVQLPFLILGLFLLFKQKIKYKWLLLLWILITYIPIALTNDSIPHALRSAITSPSYQVISAFGLISCVALISQKNRNYYIRPLLFFTVALTFWQFGNYLENYYNKYPILYAKDWQYGYKQAVDFVNQKAKNYDLIVFTRHYGEPHIFTLFFSQYDPLSFQNDPSLIRYKANDWVWVLKFGKYYFPDLGDQGTKFANIVDQNKNQKLLIIGLPGDIPEYIPRLQKIYFPDGTVAFEIAEKI